MYSTKIKADIFSDMNITVPVLIRDALTKIWPYTYFRDMDITEYTELVTNIWMKNYINSDITKEAIKKIKDAKPPKGLNIYIEFNLLTEDDDLIIGTDEIRSSPLFRAYLPTRYLWAIYIYEVPLMDNKSKFGTLDTIEPSHLQEMKKGMTINEKMNLDEILLSAYGFHIRLPGI